MTTGNPFIDPYDYNQGYRDSIDKLKDKPELVEFDRLCYELFMISEQGKRFIELLLERYIIPPLVRQDNPQYSTACVWAEGFKEALRMIRQSAISHGQRITAETNK